MFCSLNLPTRIIHRKFDSWARSPASAGESHLLHHLIAVTTIDGVQAGTYVRGPQNIKVRITIPNIINVSFRFAISTGKGVYRPRHTHAQRSLDKHMCIPFRFACVRENLCPLFLSFQVSPTARAPCRCATPLKLHTLYTAWVEHTSCFEVAIRFGFKFLDLEPSSLSFLHLSCD